MTRTFQEGSLQVLFFVFVFYFIYLFIWLRQVLVVELRIFVEVWGLFVVVLGLLSSCGMWVFSL